MRNEAINMSSAENEPHRPAVEEFQTELDRVETELTPQFIEKAEIIDPNSGQAQIVTALAELSKRLRLLSAGTRADLSEETLTKLIQHPGRSRSFIAEAINNDDLVKSLENLRFMIVHSADGIRKAMVDNHARTDAARKELEELDRQSTFYKPPLRNVAG